jgi:hypothetical protein
LRSLPLRRIPGTRQPLIPRITNPRVPCPLSVSHALRALLHPVPAGLVSCRSRPWGSTLQGSSHPRSRTPSRTPLPSCGYPAPGRYAIPPVSLAHQGRAPSASGIYSDAAPWETGHASGPCSPRASVPLTDGLDRQEAVTLMGFSLPRGFSLLAGARLEPSSHELHHRRAS